MRRLARRDAEEGRVEPVDARKEAAEAAVHLARRARLGVVERVHVPALGRDLADRVDAVAQQLPVRGEVRRAREAAGHADDRDRVLGVAGALREQLGRRPTLARRGRARATDPASTRARSAMVGLSYEIVAGSSMPELALELLGQLGGDQRVHAVARERLARIDRVGVEAELARPGARAASPRSAARACATTVVAARLRRVAAGVGAAARLWVGCAGRLLRARSTRARARRSGSAALVGAPLDLAARGLLQAAALDQHDRERRQVVLRRGSPARSRRAARRGRPPARLSTSCTTTSCSPSWRSTANAAPASARARDAAPAPCARCPAGSG